MCGHHRLARVESRRFAIGTGWPGTNRTGAGPPRARPRRAGRTRPAAKAGDDVGVHTDAYDRTATPHADAGVSRARIIGVDIARCLALIGMTATHILPEVDDAGHVSAIQQVAGGRASALFAVLAGVSLALVTGRERPLAGRALNAARVGVVVRAVIIGLIGLSIGGLDSHVAVILTYYAVLFILATPFLGLGWRPLAALAAIWAVGAPALSYVLRPHLPRFLGEVPSFDSLSHPGQLLSDITFGGYYPTVPWLTFILAGMAMGRLALGTPRVAATIAAIGAAVAFSAWSVSWLLIHPAGGFAHLVETLPTDTFVSNWPVDETLVRGFYGNTPTTSWWWQAVSSPHSTTPFDLLHVVGSAMLVLGLCILAGRLAPRALGIIFGAGTMTLTLYTLHVIALGEHWGPERGWALYALHVELAVLIGALWHTFVGSGPLEWLTTYISRAAADSVRGRPPTRNEDLEARTGPIA